MFIRICDLEIEIQNRYAFLEKMCKDYSVDFSENPAFSVAVSEEEIDEEKRISQIEMNRGAYEATVVLRKIAEEMLKYDGVLIHSAVVSVDGVGYAFMALSGVGKTTHTRLWEKYFEHSDHRFAYVNGDKPIYRFLDDRLYVYGSPWAGKEGYNTNCRVPVKGMCFIERGEKNEIVRISSLEASKQIFHQILLPEGEKDMDFLFGTLNRILENVPFFRLKCDISAEAVEVSYGEMSKCGGKTDRI